MAVSLFRPRKEVAKLSPKFRNFIIIIVIGFFFIEFGYQIIQSEEKKAAQSPIDQDGKIKEGQSVSFEKEEQLAINSFPNVKKQDYAENMLFAFSQCLLSAENIGDNGLICLSNNVADQAIDGLKAIESPVKKGQFILDYLTHGEVVTKVKTLPANRDDYLIYQLILSLNYDDSIVRYEVKINEGKIISINPHEGPIEEEKENDA